MALLALLLAVALGLAQGVRRDAPPPLPGKDDLSFYTRVIERLQRGENYDQASVQELRATNGRLKPFLVVRPPLLSEGLALLPNQAARDWALRILAAVALLAWCVRLDLRGKRLLPAAFWGVVLLSGFMPVIMTQMSLVHEAWAGVLIALSLAVYTPERWGLSLAIGLAAALLRELAAPFLLVMCAFALIERRRGESLAWLAAFAVFVLALWRHALAVEALVLPSDGASPGWLSTSGWPFLLHAASWTAWTFLSQPSIIVLFPLALLGLAAWRDPVIARAAVTVFGFSAGLLILGRPDNFYWGLVMAPLWPMGLIAAPEVAMALVGRGKDATKAPG